MEITINSSTLSQEEVQEVQKVAKELIEKGYTVHNLQYHFGRYKNLSVSVLVANEDNMVLNCFHTN